MQRCYHGGHPMNTSSQKGDANNDSPQKHDKKTILSEYFNSYVS